MGDYISDNFLSKCSDFLDSRCDCEANLTPCLSFYTNQLLVGDSYLVHMGVATISPNSL